MYSTEFKSFESIKEYIYLNKGIRVSDGFLTEMVLEKKVPYIASKQHGILINYSNLYDKVEYLYGLYNKTRSDRLKLIHKEMWNEEYDNTFVDVIPTESEYNDHYVEYIAKQKI